MTSIDHKRRKTIYHSSSNHQANLITDLPKHIIGQEIASYLPTKSIYALTLTCKRFYYTLGSLAEFWKNEVRRYFPNDERIMEFIQKMYGEGDMEKREWMIIWYIVTRSEERQKVKDEKRMVDEL